APLTQQHIPHSQWSTYVLSESFGIRDWPWQFKYLSGTEQIRHRMFVQLNRLIAVPWIAAVRIYQYHCLAASCQSGNMFSRYFIGFCEHDYEVKIPNANCVQIRGEKYLEWNIVPGQ